LYEGPARHNRAVTEAEPEISIVVPTRDRPAQLGRCLAALRAQDAARLEVVVVDDGPGGNERVKAAVEALAGARVVRTAGRGPAGARNAGARAARGPVVLFTDDDCAPEPGWARLLAAAAADRPAAGTTLNAASGAAPAAAQAITGHLQATSLSPDRARVGFAPTCNLGAPADVFERLPFDEAYPLAAGEDRDWCARATAAGDWIRWAPEAVVRHHHEMGPVAFLRQQARYGRGAARFRSASAPAPAEHRMRPALYGGLVRAGLAEGPIAGALVAAGQLATGVGFALERARPRSA
jgi:glycosyltransferase involved in cell wall biosynthesis